MLPYNHRYPKQNYTGALNNQSPAALMHHRRQVVTCHGYKSYHAPNLASLKTRKI
jgi:hypothetical protein